MVKYAFITLRYLLMAVPIKQLYVLYDSKCFIYIQWNPITYAFAILDVMYFLFIFFVKHLWHFIEIDTWYENELMLYLKNTIKSVYVHLVWRVFGGQFVHIVALAPCCDDGHNCPAACNFDNLSDGTLFRGARVFYASNDSALCVQQWPSRSLA